MTQTMFSSRKKTLPFLLFGLGLTLIAASAYFILQDVSSPTDFSTVPVKVNFDSPELTLTDIQGASHSLAGLSWSGRPGQPVGNVVPSLQRRNANSTSIL